jgi:polysaccharide transporter, PST family
MKEKLRSGFPSFTPNAKNISWHLMDKAIRMVFGLFVGAWVARYLGPDAFGTWNYVLAIVSIAGTFAVLGIDNLIIRDVVAKPGEVPELLGSAFWLRIFGTFVCLALSLVTVLILDGSNPLLLGGAAIMASAYFFQAFDVIDPYFQGHIKYKFTALSKNIAFVLLALFKVFLILSGAPLASFFWAYFIEFFVGAVFMIYFFSGMGNTLRAWKFSLSVIKEYLKEGWPLILSSLVIILHMRVDQIMLNVLRGEGEVGIYSAAVKLSEIWYIIPVAVMNTYFPSLIKKFETNKNAYWRHLRFLFDSLFWFAIVVALFIVLTAPLIIHIIYGADYQASANVLAIHFFSGIGVFKGSVTSKHLVLIKRNQVTFMRVFLGVILNVILNVILIPKYGAEGAAWATLISFLTPSYFIDFVMQRELFWFQMKSLNPVFAYRNIRNGVKELT